MAAIIDILIRVANDSQDNLMMMHEVTRYIAS